MMGPRPVDAKSAAPPDPPAAELLEQIAAIRRRRRAAGVLGVVNAASPPPAPPAAAGPADCEAVRQGLLGQPYGLAAAAPPINLVRRFYFAHELLRFHDADFVAVAYLAILKRLPFAAEAKRRAADLHCGMGRGMLLSRLRFSPEGRQFGVWVLGLSLWALIDLLRMGPQRWGCLRRGATMMDG